MFSAKLSSKRSSQISQLQSPQTRQRHKSPIEVRDQKQTPQPPAKSANEAVKKNSNAMPSAPGRRDAMPRSRPVAETMGDAMKKKAEQELEKQRKNATITEDDDE